MDLRGLRSSRRVLIALSAATLGAALLTGCTTAAGIEDATGTSLNTIVATQPPPILASSSLPTPPTTVSPTVTESTVELQRCAGQRTLSAEAVFGTQMRTDLDGDSVPDRFITYGVPNGDGMLQWRARAELVNGEPSEIELPDASGVEVAPVGALELDPIDGHLGGNEAVLRISGDEQITILGFAGIGEDGCLFRFGDALGHAAHVAVGATATTRSGLRCELVDGAQRLVELAATLDDPTGDAMTGSDVPGDDVTRFETRDRVLQRVTTNLVPAPPVTGQATLDGPALFAYSIVQCPGVTLD